MENGISFGKNAFLCITEEFQNRNWKDKTIELPIVTKYMHNGIIFRSHPYYSKSETPWHDWVMLRFNKDQNTYKCVTYKA